MIHLYHVPGTRSMRVIWLCEELRLAYETEVISFDQVFRASKQWRVMNPVGKVPVMTDGDLKVFESGAMMQYLLDRYGEGQLQPLHGTPAHAIYLQWCWFGEATFARPLGEIVNHLRAIPKEHQSQIAISEMKDRAMLCMEALDAELKNKPYLLGDDFSAADIMNGYSLFLANRYVDRPMPSHLNDYFRRLQARPGYQTAIL